MSHLQSHLRGFIPKPTSHSPSGGHLSQFSRDQRGQREYRIPLNTDHERVSALFLGPKAENASFLRKYFNIVVDMQAQGRKDYQFDDDQIFITSNIMDSETFRNTQKRIEDKFTELAECLSKQSIPFFSPRYSAHMTMDVSMPAVLGYLSTMMYNPNNVAFEASPVTTQLELEVGRQMSEMLGYNIDKTKSDEPLGWGHIACDGTVANIEAIWASRNLKFYPLSLRDAMAPGAQLDFIADTFEVQTCLGEKKLLKDLEIWELLNLPIDTVLGIPEKLYAQYGISSQFLDNVMNQYIIQTISKDELEKRWGITQTPQLFVPNTKHYSWPKAAAIAGLGSINAVDVPIDYDARMNIETLREYLQERLDNKQAVYTVVAVMGTTEEGAVDRIEEILKLRDEFRTKGLSFLVHADAAWGGYFASMVRPGPQGRAGDGSDFVPHVGLRKDTQSQLESMRFADSITIDPHKAGYVPYPAGGLCYRDGRMRYLLTWAAPYLHQDTTGESIGVYGVEGSKPGAAAAAVWLAHEVIGLHAEGYGALLGEASYSCRRFASHWAAMSDDKTDFTVVPLNPLPSELASDTSKEKVAAQKQFIRDRILFKSNEELVQDKEAMELLNQLGSDLNINAFACNFRYRDGTLNTNIEEANYLNQRIFEKLSVTSTAENPLEIPFYITATTFAQHEYKDCATRFKERLGLDANDPQDLFVLRNVVMSPFSTSGGFIGNLANTFQKVVEEEVEHVRQRNESKPMKHTFVVQGTDELFMVHTPSFHMAGGRYQIIFSGNVSGEHRQRYLQFKAAHPNTVLTLSNTTPLLLDDIVKNKSFRAAITNPENGNTVDGIEVFNVQVVKKRSLSKEDFESAYPTNFMPFYLYGTSEQSHIDHLLVLAPNIQLTASQVHLDLKDRLSAEDITKGLILYANGVHECSMQPFPRTEDVLAQQDQFFFSPNKKFNVSVYRDPFSTVSETPVKLDQVKDLITTGTMTLGSEIFIDSDKLNYEAHPDVPTALSPSKGGMSRRARRNWMEITKKFRGH